MSEMNASHSKNGAAAHRSRRAEGMTSGKGRDSIWKRDYGLGLYGEVDG